MTFFVAFPAVGLGMLNAYLAHQEHAHEERPEFKPYDFMRIRSKVLYLNNWILLLFYQILDTANLFSNKFITFY